MDNTDISAAQAQEWLQFNRAAGPQRLYALARWVINTHGPIDELDATLESLDTLWAWFLQFMDDGLTKQISPDSRSDQAVAFDFTSSDGPLALAAEALAEYTLHVIRQSYPDAEWSLFPHEKYLGVPMLYKNEVGVSTQGEWYYLHAWTVNLAGRAKRGVPQALAATRLRDIVIKHLPSVGGGQQLAPRLLLREALSFTGPVLDPPRFSAVEVDKPDAAATQDSCKPMDAVALIHVSGRWEDVEGLPPLEERKLAHLFTALDIVVPSRDIARELQAGDLQLTGLSGAVLIDSFTAGGRTRSVAFQPVNAPQEVWVDLLKRLHVFAAQYEMQVVRADDGTPLEP